jgi:3-deoxy-D-arabino-heptulosonate 7-phosphate (DAHP) synthase
MSAHSITHSITHPSASLSAVEAVAVAAVAIGAVLVVTHDGSTDQAPGQTQQQVVPPGPFHHFQTTSGGKVMTGS